MNAFWDLLDSGGPVMVPLILLSVVLYARCFGLYFTMRTARKKLVAASGDHLGSLLRLRTLRAQRAERRTLL